MASSKDLDSTLLFHLKEIELGKFHYYWPGPPEMAMWSFCLHLSFILLLNFEDIRLTQLPQLWTCMMMIWLHSYYHQWEQQWNSMCPSLNRSEKTPTRNSRVGIVPSLGMWNYLFHRIPNILSCLHPCLFYEASHTASSSQLELWCLKVL